MLNVDKSDQRNVNKFLHFALAFSNEKGSHGRLNISAD